MGYFMDFTNKQRIPLYDNYRSFIDDFTSSKMEGSTSGCRTWVILLFIRGFGILGPYN